MSADADANADAELIVRGRCACGQRYRVRHAQADLAVLCPKCGRSISITRADIAAARAGVALTPLQSDSAEVPEALPLPEDGVWLAATGSKPGRTGNVLDTPEDLVVTATLGVSPYKRPDEPLPDQAPPAAGGTPATGTPLRPFAADLLLSLACAGRADNALNLLLTTVGCTLPLLMLAFICGLIGFLGIILGFVLSFLVVPAIVLYIAQFVWRIMTRTAAGDDGLPIVEVDWDWFEDGLKPLFWLVVVTGLTLGPGLAYWRSSPRRDGTSGDRHSIAGGGRVALADQRSVGCTGRESGSAPT